MLVCEECGENSVYLNLSLNVNDYEEGELRNAIFGETICEGCGNESIFGNQVRKMRKPTDKEWNDIVGDWETAGIGIGFKLADPQHPNHNEWLAHEKQVPIREGYEVPLNYRGYN
jgi:hypothetical protein